MRRRSFIGIIIATCIASYVTLSVVGFFQPVRIALMHIALPPILSVEESLRFIRNGWDQLGFGSRTAIQGLTNQVGQLQENLLTSQARVTELEALNTAFVEGGVNEGDMPARVLMRTLDGFENTIIIDRGASDGVRTGNRIRTSSGLVGEVTVVTEHRSSVKIYSTPGHIIEGLLLDVNVPLQIQGLGLGIYSARIPSDVLPKEGMVVVNNASEKLVYGVITAVDLQPTSSFADVRIESPTNVQTIQRLFVMRSE
ncbi:MAG: rod shape-determining protein MreC [Patescibacteria group bacterium]